MKNVKTVKTVKTAKTAKTSTKSVNVVETKISDKDIKAIDKKVTGKTKTKLISKPVNPVSLIDKIKDTKKDKGFSLIDTITKGIEITKKEKPKTAAEKKAEKKNPVTKYTRDKAVCQAITNLKTFTFPELLNESDRIMVSKGYSSNPTATNVNKYGLCALIAFNVVKQDKPGTIGMKNGIKYSIMICD